MQKKRITLKFSNKINIQDSKCLDTVILSYNVFNNY